MKTTKKKAEKILNAIGENEELSLILRKMAACKTPQEIGAFIWSPQLEAELGDRSMYRNPFADWITAYAEGRKPEEFRICKNPVELATYVYPSKPGEETVLLQSQRLHLALWIENYKTKTESCLSI